MNHCAAPFSGVISKEWTRFRKVPDGVGAVGILIGQGRAVALVFQPLQATTQAWQPTQISRSMTRPSFFSVWVGNWVKARVLSSFL